MMQAQDVLEMDRDVNAAINILHVGYKHLSGGTRPTSATA
jgi:transposase